MICTRPIHGTRDANGRVYIGNDSRVAPEFKAKVRCGKCPSCTLERASDWACRLSHELVTSKSAAFVTLTYDDEHLPPGGGLETKDLIGFCKRLREAVGPFGATP